MFVQKAQHVIPNCYLKEWCDPDTPKRQTAFIWLITKDGSGRRRKSPENSFTSRHRYTVTFADGERDFTVENTLGDIENGFVEVRERIKRHEMLSIEDRVMICLFTAAMRSRTIRAGDHWAEQNRKLHEMVTRMEQQYELEPKTSLETGEMLRNAAQRSVMMSLEIETPLYLQMEMAVLEIQDERTFITSDSPCVWFNPKAHTFPPFYRSPGLAQSDIEVTLPLKPKHMVLFSHIHQTDYIGVGGSLVDGLNRRTRAFTTNEFVSWKGQMDPSWFVKRALPADAWESTEEGKKSLQRQTEWDEIRTEWERKTGRKR
jgi:Protein of unknown function (DUF4238)